MRTQNFFTNYTKNVLCALLVFVGFISCTNDKLNIVEPDPNNTALLEEWTKMRESTADDTQTAFYSTDVFNFGLDATFVNEQGDSVREIRSNNGATMRWTSLNSSSMQE